MSQTMVLHATLFVIIGKLSMSSGASTWFETIWSYDVKAIDYRTIFSTMTE
jgi:hypothetical protein